MSEKVQIMMDCGHQAMVAQSEIDRINALLAKLPAEPDTRKMSERITQGEWRVGVWPNDSTYTAIFDELGFLVAVVNYHDMMPSSNAKNELAANLAAIQHVPELLRAVETVVETWEGCEVDNSFLPVRLSREALAAVRKAVQS